MDEQLLEKMIKEIVSNINNTSNSRSISNSSVEVSAKDYPLGYNRKDLIKTSTGKSLDDITLDAVMNDRVGPNDVRITAETLEYQAKIAESVGRKDRILEIYNALRPFRSTKAELIAIADELESKYSAKISASLVREAAEVYEKRDRLRRK